MFPLTTANCVAYFMAYLVANFLVTDWFQVICYRVNTVTC